MSSSDSHMLARGLIGGFLAAIDVDAFIRIQGPSPLQKRTFRILGGKSALQACAVLASGLRAGWMIRLSDPLALYEWTWTSTGDDEIVVVAMGAIDTAWSERFESPKSPTKFHRKVRR